MTSIEDYGAKYTRKVQKGTTKMNAPELFTLLSTHPLYIDPSAVTVAVSSISGIVIAVGAAVAIWWTRAKKKAAEKLHIDTNAHKEVEEDLVINDEETSSPVQPQDDGDSQK